ncbi:FecR family protein [Paucibacter sp. XJ19-41]|uniref:FecR family protein n=1 Tax=Paucibacter sp. XJ19-41 TaxID=2927824 RepID=UPI00234AB51F|nr:FecR domain-containing protein [Paucibacter sp. XJ19-41]MDC6166575.1 FecR domain-containing protein [Paucibacter sp. XJ19-41]
MTGADGRDGRDGQGEERQGAEPVVTREIAAEAAVWIARLHGPDRSNHMERECRAWQARSAAHRLAFERGTDLWMEAAGVDRAAVARAAASRPESRGGAGQGASPSNAGTRGWGWPRPWALALSLTATVLVVGVLVGQPWRDIDSYDTGIGEQRLVILKDGTRMSLNTSTQVRVALGASRRAVEVIGGEALFEVAKDASRPFVVRAAGSEVTATGTAFVVRYRPAIEGSQDALDITLVEGRVVVRGAAEGSPTTELVPAVEMLPGQRLRVAGRSRGQVAAAVEPQMDRPHVDQVLAWKRGEAVFDDVSLLEAVAEMNRYSSVTIRVADGGALGSLRVSGVFKTGDNLSFARALGKLHGLEVRQRGDRLELEAR